MTILFIVRVKILVHMKRSCKSPTIMLIIEPRMVIIFWVRSPMSLNYMSFLASNLGAASNHIV